MSKVSLYRVAVHKDKVLDAIKLANAIAEKGYKVAIQLMGIVGYTDEDFKKVLGPLKQSNVNYVYFADSYGSLLPSDIKRHISMLRKTGKLIGFHPHNNLQLGFANALEAIRCGVDIVDGTVFGIGRGSGNLPIETLITYFEKAVDNTRYNVLPVLELIDEYFISLSQEVKWGYNLPYMISGIYGVHPNYARALIESGGYSIDDVKSVLQLVNKMNPIGFDEKVIPKIKRTGFVADQDFEIKAEVGRGNYPVGKVAYQNRHKGRDFLILANGASLVSFRDKLNQFIEKHDPVIIGSNYLGGMFVPHYHSFNNEKRLAEHVGDVHPDSKLLLGSSLSKEFVAKHTGRVFELIQNSCDAGSKFNIKDGVIVNDCRSIAVLSVAVAIVMGAKQIFIAGMDGYKDVETFLTEGIQSSSSRSKKKEAIKISARSGEYKEQMEWHAAIDGLLKQINEYLVSKGLNDLIIITPTTHKSFYESVDAFLNKES
jgi:4-hydroxy 2-oxovalerate aldolase